MVPCMTNAYLFSKNHIISVTTFHIIADSGSLLTIMGGKTTKIITQVLIQDCAIYANAPLSSTVPNH